MGTALVETVKALRIEFQRNFKWGFAKISGTILGVSIFRIVLFWGLC